MLESNKIHQNEVKSLAEYLEKNGMLKVLNLCRVLILFLADTQMRQEDAICIAKALKFNNSLTSLFLCIFRLTSIGLNGIGTKGAEAIMEAMNALTSLDISKVA
eukprot:TRINITY_DN1110_c0_g2_i1.p1 TRINITY_DN1110_c0_g2~~TRINITY_DN1110_c0_g2_i1.p1  ORF type:complete len:104 (+),score=10.92 TRINITY_DN1110_c0_g2_i1:679-990(+)